MKDRQNECRIEKETRERYLTSAALTVRPELKEKRDGETDRPKRILSQQYNEVKAHGTSILNKKEEGRERDS